MPVSGKQEGHRGLTGFEDGQQVSNGRISQILHCIMCIVNLEGGWEAIECGISQVEWHGNLLFLAYLIELGFLGFPLGNNCVAWLFHFLQIWKHYLCSFLHGFIAQIFYVSLLSLDASRFRDIMQAKKKKDLEKMLINHLYRVDGQVGDSSMLTSIMTVVCRKVHSAKSFAFCFSHFQGSARLFRYSSKHCHCLYCDPNTR